jgi:outer membrane protein OmpA-like peptidoglycan-associated protein
VRTGETVTLRAEASDPDGDPLTFVWSATGGSLADTRAAATTWRAETAPGLITLAVTARDGRGGEASDVVTVEVASGIEFEDVHFDFDSFRLRREALPLLEPAVTALRERPQMRLVIEGHTCSIGTAEYNMALGERRANAVRDYLISRGVDADRLSTVSYGENHPAHDNSEESTRRLNRRAVLVVRTADSESD